MRTSFFIACSFGLLLASASALAAPDSTLIYLNNSSYFCGREYYVLRSGRVQMFVQSDKANLGSAFTYLLFDAQNASQSARKENAGNYSPLSGFQTSALEVSMGNFPFTALGQNTVSRWIYENGIPKVEAVWWAGGIKVTEKISAIVGQNTFVRSITLFGAQIVDTERVKLRLGVPDGEVQSYPGMIVSTGQRETIAVAVGQEGLNTDEDKNYLEINAEVPPGSAKTYETFVAMQLTSGDTTSALDRIRNLKSGGALLEQTRAAWKLESTVKTPDAVLQELYDNVRFTLPGYVSDVGIMDAGVFEYGGQWIRDASNTTLGLLQIGQFELARGLLSHMMDSMITNDGATMISSNYEKPENEEFDQMGELWDAMKNYYYWSGDSSLLKKNALKLIAMTNRPLRPEFCDSTGMVHNKREYWERFATEGYELAYQIYVIEGLRDAIELARIIGAQDYVATWKAASSKMLRAMLHDPKLALVHNGALIKRRSPDGHIVDTVKYAGYIIDSPALTESLQRLLPDAEMALPIALGIVDPKSALAKKTLDELMGLWNSRWSFGGFDRYNTSSQPDQPGPWPFATCFILRAQHEAGMYARSRETLEWLHNVQGGHSGAYFEEIPITRNQSFTAGILPWPAAEVALFVVRHWLGVSFKDGHVVLKPNLYPGTGRVEASLRYNGSRIDLVVEDAGRVKSATVNGKPVKPQKDGSVVLPSGFKGGKVILKVR
ncbi:MAG TPA: hypothetical protein VIS48_04225 [Candidatus Kryptonia bacterium]